MHKNTKCCIFCWSELYIMIICKFVLKFVLSQSWKKLSLLGRGLWWPSANVSKTMLTPMPLTTTLCTTFQSLPSHQWNATMSSSTWESALHLVVVSDLTTATSSILISVLARGPFLEVVWHKSYEADWTPHSSRFPALRLGLLLTGPLQMNSMCVSDNRDKRLGYLPQKQWQGFPFAGVIPAVLGLLPELLVGNWWFSLEILTFKLWTSKCFHLY